MPHPLRTAWLAERFGEAWMAVDHRWFPCRTLATLLDYLHEVEHVADRIERLAPAIDQAVTTAPERMRAVIEALQALRGVAQVQWRRRE